LPLRRRVRGATLPTTLGAAAGISAPQVPRLTDADAVRRELEEFEAAVARADRDSAATDSSTTPHETGLPEGADQ